MLSFRPKSNISEPYCTLVVILNTTQEYPVLLENALQPLLLPGRGFLEIKNTPRRESRGAFLEFF